MFLELDIYDCHEVQTPDDTGDLNVEPFDWWHKFKISIDLNQVGIEAFREYVLFISKDEKPIQCTMIMLTTGNVLYCVDKYSKFKEKFDKIKKESI